jgi:hypothetical protein
VVPRGKFALRLLPSEKFLCRNENTKELVLITDLGLEKFLIGSTNDELP